MSDSDVKFERYASIGTLLKKLVACDARHGRVRFPLEVGILRRLEFNDLIETGRLIGLDVDVTHLGGWLVRRYRVTVTGNARLIYVYLTHLQRLLSQE